MRKKIIALCVGFALVASLAYASSYGVKYLRGAILKCGKGIVDTSLTVGTTLSVGTTLTAASFQCDATSGTALRGIYIGTDTFDNGSTTTATTISGVIAGDLAKVTTISGNPNGVAMKTVVCTENTVTSVYANPGAATNVIIEVTGF